MRFPSPRSILRYPPLPRAAGERAQDNATAWKKQARRFGRGVGAKKHCNLPGKVPGFFIRGDMSKVNPLFGRDQLRPILTLDILSHDLGGSRG